MKQRLFRPKKLLVLAFGVAALAVTVIGVASGASGQFQATFEGVPANPAPMPSVISDFDIQIHSRDPDTWFQLEPINAQHGSDCSAPPATHVNTSYEGSVFQCKNHLMTALNASGYGVIYLTPNQIFDFSSGGSLSWEMSTEKQSSRDWWDVLITPYDQNMSVPLLSNLSQGVDLQGAPLNTIHIGGDNGEGAPLLTIVRNGVETQVNSVGDVPTLGYQVVGGTNEAATRQTFKFTVGGGRMKFERLQSATATALVYWDVAASANFTSGIVQIGHHSYNPTKDGAGVPATRHWDNVTISPAEPFTMIKADRRYTQGGTVNFGAPAPANAFLRFTGICKIAVNGKVVSRVPDYDRWGMGYHAEHMSSYFVPIAQGTQSVNFTFADDDWYNLDCIAKDFSIWSKSGGTSQPAATATSTPIPSTATSVPATSTPTQTASPSPPTTAPSSTPTTVPSSTPTKPAATPTKAPPTATPTTPTNPPPSAAGSRIAWNGKTWYVHGANLPWFNWGCDFGCGSNGGASSSSVNSSVDAAFAQAKANGINVVRWWVFPGDPWQINRASDGTPTGLNPAVYADLDAAVALAAKHDIYLDLVLFSAPSAMPQSWLNTPAQRQKLADALGPMFARYKDNPRVMTWEIINEPEFDIWDGKVSQPNVQATVKALAASVHANSPTLVTVGSAMLDGLGMWVGQGLDYYQAHWYDYMQPGKWCARCTDYDTVKSSYGLDKPLVIGEFYASNTVDALQRHEDWYAKGYAGAWAWSLLPARTNDGMSVDLAASKTFAGRHSDIGPKGTATSAPTATPTKPAATAAPSSTPTKPAATPTKPAPTATPTQVTAQVTASLSLSKSSLSKGQTQRFTTTVKSTAATKLLVDVEVYGPDGKRVYQRFYDGQSFAAGQSKTFNPTWTVPISGQKGTYTVKVGVFAPGWGKLYFWNDSAATFTVK